MNGSISNLRKKATSNQVHKYVEVMRNSSALPGTGESPLDTVTVLGKYVKG